MLLCENDALCCQYIVLLCIITEHILFNLILLSASISFAISGSIVAYIQIVYIFINKF